MKMLIKVSTVSLVVFTFMSGSVGSAHPGDFGDSAGSVAQADGMPGSIILVDGGYEEQMEQKKRNERRAREQADQNIKDDRWFWEKMRASPKKNKKYWEKRYRENQKKMNRQKREGGSNRGQNRNNDADHNYGAPDDGIY